MKKVIMLLMSAMLITFNSCQTNEPSTPADKDVTEQDADIDPDQATTVTVTGKSHIAIDNINIYNSKDKLVGSGAYKGDYLVPYNGSIEISYYYIYDTSVRKTDRYKVGTAKTLKIGLYCINELYSEVITE